MESATPRDGRTLRRPRPVLARFLTGLVTAATATSVTVGCDVHADGIARLVTKPSRRVTDAAAAAHGPGHLNVGQAWRCELPFADHVYEVAGATADSPCTGDADGAASGASPRRPPPARRSTPPGRT